MTTSRVVADEVIGVDAGLTSERQGEHALVAVADALDRHGLHGVWLATHRAATRDGVHVALTLSFSGVPDRSVRVADLVRRTLGDPDAAVADGAGAAGPPNRVEAAVFARRSLVERTEGRTVRFPGSSSLVGTVRIGDVTEHSAVDRVQVLAGAELRTDAPLQTRDFVRPRFERGELVLHVQPAGGGVFVPFETPNPTPCCADHST